MKPLINPFTFAQSLIQERGSWTVAVIETSIFWPPQIQAVEYEGKNFILMPYEQVQGVPTPTLPAIALKADSYNLSAGAAKKVILEFASALAWLEGGKLEIVHWTGGDRPRSMGVMRNNGISNYLDPEHIPQYLGENARTSLAFFREGISLENPFYSFFSLYKAFTVAISDAKNRGAWMNANKGILDNHLAIKRLRELEVDGHDVGEYLYSECRHAIAHADKEPFVNPDQSEDLIEISKNLPLIRSYVELALEESFGIKRLKTIYKEHLYELDGFRGVVDSEAYAILKAGGVLDQDLTINIPDNLRFVARREQHFYVLEPFNADTYALTQGGIILNFKSANELIELRIYLDFLNEKLRFDPLHDFNITSNRSNQSAISYEIDALEFKRCILSNGVLEVWDSNHRLGCTEAYIPINAMVNFRYFDDQINELKGMLK
jgi:hypothetical protein